MKEHLTIQELATEVERRSRMKVDHIVASNDIRFHAIPAEIDRLTGGGAPSLPDQIELAPGHIVDRRWWESLGRTVPQTNVVVKPQPVYQLEVLARNGGQHNYLYGVNELAHDQIARHLGIPTAYYDKLRPDFPELLQTNVQTLLEARPMNEKRMVRTLDGTVRAFLSNSYEPRDNWDLLRFILPMFGPRDIRLGTGEVIKCLRKPGSNEPLLPTFRSADITDTRLYIKIVAQELEAELKVGTVVRAGVLIQNSEVGLGSFVVMPFYEVLACTNGAILTNFGARKRHVGRAKGEGIWGGNGGGDDNYDIYSDQTKYANDKAFFLSMADVVRATFTQDVFNKMLEPIRASMGQRITGHPVAAVTMVGKMMNLGEGEQEDILRYLIDGGDLSQWGLSNAVTRYSQDVESYDRATELEAIGGDIVTLTPAEWRTIGEATVSRKSKSANPAALVAVA